MITTTAVKKLLRRFARKTDGNVLMEAAMVFPILVVMLMGTVDAGRALLVNKNLVTAAHMTADLIARENSINDSRLAEYTEAGRLGLQPFPTGSYGIDIVGVRFEGPQETPVIAWRETSGMPPISDVLSRAEGLGRQNEGVIVVTAAYSYQPRFFDIFKSSIEMRETAFARGRDTAFIARE